MTFNDFLPYILPRARGCAEIIAAFQARLALIEFCQQTGLWREEQTPVLTVANQTSYSYAPAAGQQVVQLLELKIGGTSVPVVDPRAARGYSAASLQAIYGYGTLSGFELRPAQAASLPIVTYSIVAPAITAEAVPDLFANYADTVARGALYRLLRTVGQSYTDIPLSVAMKAEFDEDIGEARTAALRGLAQTVVRTAPFSF